MLSTLLGTPILLSIMWQQCNRADAGQELSDARQAGFSVSETADPLGFLHPTVSTFLRMIQKTNSEQQTEMAG